MDSTELKDFIDKHKKLFWHVADSAKKDLSLDVVTEYVLNYGDINAVRDFFSTVGLNNVAEVFYKQSSKVRSNYNKQVANYFNLYFGRHASKYSGSKSA